MKEKGLQKRGETKRHNYLDIRNKVLHLKFILQHEVFTIQNTASNFVLKKVVEALVLVFRVLFSNHCGFDPFKKRQCFKIKPKTTFLLSSFLNAVEGVYYESSCMEFLFISAE